MAEMEEYQLSIASNEEVLQQVFSVALSPSFDFGTNRVAIRILEHLPMQ